jgi:DNA-binding winged helix-turn-helix (wHTH) protein
MGPRCFSFGPFVLIPERQLLLKEGSPVRVGARALEILTVLVERSGQLLNKEEIISSVWTDTFVDESNLKVNIAAIRKAIDPIDSTLSCIVTVIGRGYRFVEPVTIAAMGAEISLWNVYPERKSTVDQQSAGFSDTLLSSA